MVARWQLIAIGMTAGAIERRVTRGRLRPIHRGVYAVGHTALTIRGRMSAAVLAGGPDAVLSYNTAARLRDLPAPGGAMHVTVPRKLASRPGLRFHHHRLADDEVDELDGIPVTTCARTVFDLAAVLPGFRLEKIIREAEYRRLSDVVSLPALIARYPGSRGNRQLRAILELDDLSESRTESELEDRFRAFIDARGLPRPRFNVPMTIDGLALRADCVWFREGLIVELDGRGAHERAAAFERDRNRDRKLLAAGWRTARVTSRQLELAPDELDADLRSLVGVRRTAQLEP